jgi:hypothetical protein
MGNPSPQGTLYVKRKKNYNFYSTVSFTPRGLPREWNLCSMKVLEKMTVICSVEGQNYKSMIPSCTKSRCSACGSQCASSTTSELDLCRTLECSGFHTR